jgi:catechol 2,3-dioxygenase-like lactoylglutathione lyase family enzyme
MTVAFRHAGLTVADLERSLRFWRDGLGLELAFQQEKSGGYMERITAEAGVEVRQAHLRFLDGCGWIELLQYTSPPGRPMTPRAVDPGSGHVAVTCPDLVTLLARLVEHGGVPLNPPTTLESGANAGAVAVYLRDPDQHILELVQPPPG